MQSDQPHRTPPHPAPHQTDSQQTEQPDSLHADSRGYYLALHVSPDASQQEISRAFRAIIRVRHPDVGYPGGQGGDDVRSILAAFAVLRNPRTRAEYDRAEHAAAARIRASEQSPRKSPAHDSPDRGVPVRGVPVRGVPVRDVPVRDVPVRTSPARAVPPRTVPPRDIPVRTVRQQGPLLRVSPVRWERGPG